LAVRVLAFRCRASVADANFTVPFLRRIIDLERQACGVTAGMWGGGDWDGCVTEDCKLRSELSADSGLSFHHFKRTDLLLSIHYDQSAADEPELKHTMCKLTTCFFATCGHIRCQFSTCRPPRVSGAHHVRIHNVHVQIHHVQIHHVGSLTGGCRRQPLSSVAVPPLARNRLQYSGVPLVVSAVNLHTVVIVTEGKVQLSDATRAIQKGGQLTGQRALSGNVSSGNALFIRTGVAPSTPEACQPANRSPP
jgi:hypothetical protein